ncbi:MAG: DUF4367 domain-containing protein [Aestuariibacter sp.]|jgi:hypothetical protein|nr:DUF4367 domain-containing protein [Aestuariibacter sp.]MCP4238216.1 DUF4367 domain-containing protein [Aestuariibacter sp.]MCP4529283.1 DUF4367 domain-containing protein [Aestuariibacter sp.]MCP4949416.1 DUF4367 domain-containing protein [Aestuariibacter sp.]
MTVDSIPAGKSDPGKVESPRTSLNKQLQQEGLRQAREFQQSTQSVQLSVSQTAVSNKVVVTAMEQNVVVNERRFDNSQYTNAAPEASKSLFDFETVANNVLKFVGGVVRGAAKSGADDETLTDLIGQARSGVAKGIAMAQKDLAGLMNSEISQGIEKSREAIGNGINELEDEVLGKSEAASGIMAQQLFAQNMNAEQAGLVIRTKDGDEVSLYFGQARQVSYNASYTYNAPINTGSGTSATSGSASFSYNQSLQYTEYSGVSFAVKGDLDEGELSAISDLLKQITDVSRSFFDGDMESAFNKALELGFDEKELAGFSLQLDRKQVSEKISAYQQNESEVDNKEALRKQLEPLKAYVEQLKSMQDLLDKTLEVGTDYSKVINGVINQMTDVHVPDVVSAINRYHQFNSKLTDNPQTN